MPITKDGNITDFNEWDTCDRPCGYPGCDYCKDYWKRMVDEGLWTPEKGWTDKGWEEFCKT